MKASAKEAERLLQRILDLLQHLRVTPEGCELYSRIDQGLALSDKYSNYVRQAFISYLNAQLRQYLNVNVDDTATRLIAKLVQRRIDPYVKQLLDSYQETGPTEDKYRGVDMEKLEAHIASVLWHATTMPQDMADEPRSDLGARRRKLEASQDAMAKNTSATLVRNADLLSNLKMIRYALETTNSDDIKDLRKILLCAVEEVIDWQQSLAGQLQENSKRLKEIRSDNIKLHKEIAKVRQSTLTDEFTGLPNRLAFMQSLEAEVGRARRHKYPLTICLLAVDDDVMVSTPESREHVLRSYADEVVSRFRGYDMVARVGEKEFAVFLPNTNVDGAVRALTEAQNRAVAEKLQSGNRSSDELPSFSCGVALARPEEPAEGLMQRAYQALKQAARDGRRMLEISSREEPAYSASGDPAYRLH
ncbi:MAG: hypothetical protein BMS9Abin33_0739 [Gammaproteobacteria bacterium]|nr:MAG: hypothetical protein BMS9Abin33_0739 [Gammaproteobacteria bacterium]